MMRVGYHPCLYISLPFLVALYVSFTIKSIIICCPSHNDAFKTIKTELISRDAQSCTTQKDYAYITYCIIGNTGDPCSLDCSTGTKSEIRSLNLQRSSLLYGQVINAKKGSNITIGGNYYTIDIYGTYY